jgi:hypothetical protein
MALNTETAHSAGDDRYAQELQYLHERLNTVDNLIRTLEAYDLIRPRPVQFPTREKTA